MARATKVMTEEAPAEPVTETITYTPGPMDPVTVKWGGHVFQANVPKEITGHAEGTSREQLNHSLIESARTNRHFMVGGERKKRDAIAEPQTPEEYRAYCIAWLKEIGRDGNPVIQTTEQLISRFARDRDLQKACEVGHDDYTYIATLFMPKLHELQRAEELSDPQVATIWVNHGVNQLPW